MNCAELAPLLALAALPHLPGDGDEPPLPAGEAARVAAHLAACPTCRQAAEALTHAFRGVEPMSRETAVLEPLTPELRTRTLLAMEQALAPPATRVPAPPVEAAAAARRPDSAEEGDDSLLREFLLFLREEKRWWMAPLLTVLLMLSVVIVFAEGSAVAPFIYTLF